MIPMDPASLVMERKMLQGIKQRAESLPADQSPRSHDPASRTERLRRGAKTYHRHSETDVSTAGSRRRPGSDGGLVPPHSDRAWTPAPIRRRDCSGMNSYSAPMAVLRGRRAPRRSSSQHAGRVIGDRAVDIGRAG
jgi:hypothetical protein